MLDADKELKIAIIRTQIEKLEEDRKNGVYNSSHPICSREPLICELFKKNMSDIQDGLSFIDNYMKVIDNTCGKRTNWEKSKKQLLDEIEWKKNSR